MDKLRDNNRLLLVLLTTAFALNHLDRHILNITLNDIGVEFQLTDLQLGTLSGLAFAVIYVVLGFPVAKLSRAGRRKPILVSAIGLWSLMTMAIGVTGNYVQIFLARFGVGVGEAGCVPPSHAMIADAYPPQKRASALAVFSAGTNIGIFLAFLGGGIVAHKFGWRAAFLAAGLPGILLALIMVFKLHEPAAPPEVKHEGEHSFKALLGTLLSETSTRHVIFGATLTALVGFGAIAWIAAFLSRIHGMQLAQVGLYLAIVIGVLGALGTWLGGVASDYLGKERPDWRLKFVGVTILVAKPLSIVFYLSDGLVLALVVFAVPAAVGSMFTGPSFAHIYSKLPSAQRPMATAVMMFLFNLIGLGLGPVMVGFISDMLAAHHGENSLRYALVVLQLSGLWAAVHFWLAGNAVKLEKS